MHVQLQLLRRAVAGADRLAAGMARQMLPNPFWQERLAVDRVHDVRGLAVAQAAMGEEVGKAVGLARIAEHAQRVEGEAGVAQPAVAVVPVARPADLLGQRGGGGGHHRAGRRIGKQLQREGAAGDGIGIWAAIAVVPDPLLPKAAGHLEQTLAVSARIDQRFERAQDRALDLAGFELESDLGAVVADRDRAAAPHAEPLGAQGGSVMAEVQGFQGEA